MINNIPLQMLHFQHLFTVFLFSIPIVNGRQLPQSNENVISIPYHYLSGSYALNISLGIPGNYFLTRLSQSLEHSIFSEQEYPLLNSGSSKVISNETAYELDDDWIYTKRSVLDTLRISNQSQLIFLNFGVLPAFATSRMRNTGISLGYKVKQNDHNLVYQYKAQGYINKNSYAFIPGSSGVNSGHLILGGIPDKHWTKYPFKQKCSVISLYNSWGCKLQYIFIGDVSYVYENTHFKNNYFMSFNVEYRGIVVPEDVYRFLKNKIFKNFIEDGTCGDVLFFGKKYFTCNEDLWHSKDFSLPKVTFVIEGHGYEIDWLKYFSASLGGKCDFWITESTDERNYFILGNYFVEDYVMSFDYDNSWVAIYSKERIEEIDWDKLFPFEKLGRWFVYLMIVAIVVMVLKHVWNENVGSRKGRNAGLTVETFYRQMDNM